jgi:hypothetical protein
MNPTKYCGCCGQTVLLANFAKNKAKKDGLQERCKSCRSGHYQKVKHLRPKPTTEQRRRYLIKSYGLTVAQYELILKNQNNSCAICKTKEWGKPSPSIDHCHKTSKVRGLLCNFCNRGLGFFNDDIERLENAKKYVARPR